MHGLFVQAEMQSSRHRPNLVLDLIRVKVACYQMQNPVPKQRKQRFGGGTGARDYKQSPIRNVREVAFVDRSPCLLGEHGPKQLFARPDNDQAVRRE